MTWGPFTTDIDDAERLARLRCLAALVRVLAGPTGATVVAALRVAERDAGAVAAASDHFERLPALARRRALALYAELHRPEVPHAR